MYKDTIGVLLAGGISTRMGGGDKCLVALDNRTVLSHVIDRSKSQTSKLIINANGDPERFKSYGLPVIPDIKFVDAGPLAGIYTGLKWARNNESDAQYIASFATDTPFLPLNYVDHCRAAIEETGSPIALASSNGRIHPVFGVFSINLVNDLEEALSRDQIRKIDIWTKKHNAVQVSFDIDDYDPFFNINSPEDLIRARQIFSSRKMDLK